VSITFGLTGNGSPDVPAVATDTVPMSEMKPGQYGCIVTVDDPDRIASPGDLVQRDRTGYSSKRLSDAHIIESTGITVRPCKPGDKLTIECVDEPDDNPTESELVVGSAVWNGQRCDACTNDLDSGNDEPCNHCCVYWREKTGLTSYGKASWESDNPGVAPLLDEPLPETLQAETDAAEDARADDKFERLADGETRIGCWNCTDFRARASGCLVDKTNSRPFDKRGLHDHAHPCWRPSEPKTLDDALRTGTAEEMESIARATDSQAALVFLDAVADEWQVPWGKHTHVCISLIANVFLSGSRNNDLRRAFTDNTSLREMTVEFVALRDRFDLFGDGERKTDDGE
jgi:hypothetical protein